MLLRRKFLFLFPSFFNINLLYMFKIIQIAKNWNDTCVRGLEISHWKVRKYRPPLQSSQSNSPRDLRKAVVRLTTWFMHCDVETSTKRFAFQVPWSFRNCQDKEFGCYYLQLGNHKGCYSLAFCKSQSWLNFWSFSLHTVTNYTLTNVAAFFWRKSKYEAKLELLIFP